MKESERKKNANSVYVLNQMNLFIVEPANWDSPIAEALFQILG